MLSTILSLQLTWQVSYQQKKHCFDYFIFKEVCTLSLKCPCGYIKHDVIHIGDWLDCDKRLIQFCGGLYLVDSSGDFVTCTNKTTSIEFYCAFCGHVTIIGVQERVAKKWES